MIDIINFVPFLLVIPGLSRCSSFSHTSNTREPGEM